MNPVRKLREQTSVTQARLANLGGTSQPTIAAYESEMKSVTLKTMKRLAKALGLEVDVRFVRPLTREERRSVVLHRMIAKKLEANPKTVLDKAQRVLKKMLETNPSAAPLLREWEILLSRSVPDLVEMLTDLSPHARELRQVTPFAGVLSARERARVYRSFRNTLAEKEK